MFLLSIWGKAEEDDRAKQQDFHRLDCSTKTTEYYRKGTIYFRALRQHVSSLETWRTNIDKRQPLRSIFHDIPQSELVASS